MQKSYIILLILILQFSIKTESQEIKTTAFFMLGNYSDKEWEKLSFEAFDDFEVITYSYAKNEKGVRLKVLGTRLVSKVKSIVVMIPGISKTYYIIPDRVNERIIFKSSDGSYYKVLKLGYEGPIEGIGTYCSSCANEPDEAFEFIDYFLRK